LVVVKNMKNTNKNKTRIQVVKSELSALLNISMVLGMGYGLGYLFFEAVFVGDPIQTCISLKAAVDAADKANLEAEAELDYFETSHSWTKAKAMTIKVSGLKENLKEYETYVHLRDEVRRTAADLDNVTREYASECASK
jgi:hypothetical protein